MIPQSKMSAKKNYGSFKITAATRAAFATVEPPKPILPKPTFAPVFASNTKSR